MISRIAHLKTVKLPYRYSCKIHAQCSEQSFPMHPTNFAPNLSLNVKVMRKGGIVTRGDKDSATFMNPNDVNHVTKFSPNRMICWPML